MSHLNNQKMTHFVVLIIIPRRIYLQGDVAIQKYIAEVMAPYDEERVVVPYIYQTKAQFEEEYQKFKASGQDTVGEYDTIEKYRADYCGHDLIDQAGNILSAYNKDCFWDWYVVGGRWEGEVLHDQAKATPVGRIANNSLSVKSFLERFATDKEKYTYRHLLDQNGSFHQDRKMGWFASYEPLVDDKEWASRFETILRCATDHFIVFLDCHI